MVQLQLLLVSLAAVASVSAVPANQQRINPNFAPKPGQKFQQKFGGNKGKAPAAMWFQPGGVPNKYRPSAGGAASFRGRPGRRPNKGGNNGAGNAGAGNGNAGAGNANAGAGNGNQNNAGGNGNNNNAGTGNNNGGGGSNNAVDGAQDTGIANVVELCTNPDGRTACFMILGDTKGSCFTIPHPIANNVQFFLPPPGGTCSLFDDQDCNAAALTPAQGVVAQNAKLAWSCTAAAAAAPPPATTTTTTTTTAATTTTTSSAASTTTSKANNGGKGKGNAGKGNAGKGNTGAGNTGAAKGNTGANTGATAGKGNTGAAKGNTGAAKGNTGTNTGANTGANAGKGNTGASTGATAGKGNQANAGSGSGTNNAVAGSQNLDFGSCSNPTIQFAQGLPGRNAKEFGFQAVNTQDFPHGAALNIGVITDFVCLQFINKCGLKQDSPTIAACRAAEQAALPLQGGAAADAFNKGLGFETNFAAVGGNGNNGNNGNNGGNNNGGNNGGNNGNNGNNNGNNGGNNGANGQTDSGVANVIEGCTNPDGATRCFQILADTKESCFTLPPPLANNVAFWLPPPGANCVLFTDQDCTSAPTTAFGVINNVKQNSWSCKLNDA